VGFFDTIGRGWKLSKLSFSVVKADPELLLYTFISALMVFATIGAAAYPAYEADTTVNPDGKYRLEILLDF